MRHFVGCFPLFLASLVACEGATIEPPPEPPAPLACESIADAVVWTDDLVEEGPCPGERTCGIEEYLAVPDIAPELTIDLSEEELDEQLAALNSGFISHEDRVGSTELRNLILTSTRFDALVDGFEDRPLVVDTVRSGNDYSWRTEWEGHQPDMPYRQLLATDPIVGTFEVLVFRPPLDRGDGPFPAIVVAHGHGDGAWSHAARVDFGEKFTQAGYIVVIPVFRASEGDTPETLVTRGLLRKGWSLLGIRIYETMLGRRIAASLPEVEPCAPVGLVGHSGGSISSLLTVRVMPDGLGFDAYVNDLTSTYLNWDPHGGWTLDETLPALWPYSDFINNMDVLPMPTMAVGYGYPEGVETLTGFFDLHL